jgi:DNA-binding NtrC family response regulator
MFERILMAGSTFPEPLLSRLQQSTAKLITVPTLEEACKQLQKNEAFDLVFADCQAAFFVIEELLAAAAASGNCVIGLVDAADTKRRAKLEETSIFDIHPLPSSDDANARLIRNAYRYLKLHSEVQYHRGLLAPPEELIGRSENMRRIITSIQKNALLDKPILLSGPHGSGKDLIARSLHRHSTNANGPLFSVECAGVPEGMLEAQIYGRTTGTSISHRRQRLPYLPLASGGTLVVNNIDAMSLKLQEKLLAHLQKKDGGTFARIICTTRKVGADFDNPEVLLPKLRDVCEVLTLPSLQDREGDVLLLADYFVRVYSADMNRNVKLDVSAREALQKHDWPGNVEELKCFIQRALLVSPADKLDAAALALPGYEGVGIAAHAAPGEVLTGTAPNAAGAASKVPPSSDTITFKIGNKLADVEREMMLRTVEKMNGNRTQAAAMLGISVRTLYTRLLETQQPQETKSETA